MLEFEFDDPCLACLVVKGKTTVRGVDIDVDERRTFASSGVSDLLVVVTAGEEEEEQDCEEDEVETGQEQL
jgi:hypothetical protein